MERDPYEGGSDVGRDLAPLLAADPCSATLLVVGASLAAMLRPRHYHARVAMLTGLDGSRMSNSQISFSPSSSEKTPAT